MNDTDAAPPNAEHERANFGFLHFYLASLIPSVRTGSPETFIFRQRSLKGRFGIENPHQSIEGKVSRFNSRGNMCS